MTLAAKSLLLQSVFPSTTDSFSSPTPQATPLLTQGSFNQSSGNDSNVNPGFNDTASEAVRWERAWHTATLFLSEKIRGRGASKECPPDVQTAIEYLRSPSSTGWKLRDRNKADDLLWWYSQAFQEECLQRHGPTLRKQCRQLTGEASSWYDFRAKLMATRAACLDPFHRFISPVIGASDECCERLLENAYGALIHQILLDRVSEPFQDFMKTQAAQILYSQESTNPDNENSMEGVESSQQEEAQSCVLETLSDLIEGGLPSESLERLLAQALASILKIHVRISYARCWESPSCIVDELKEWVSGPFVDFASRCLGAVRKSHPDVYLDEVVKVGTDIWHESAVRELGLLRLGELFDIVVDWDNGSRGGIEDLRHYATSQQTRQQIVSNFSETLSYRLLHPGASTDQILEIYIKIMRAFAVLDPRFVILDRVSRPIRRYLRDRDDTVRIIIAGLLSDPNNPESSPDALGELAVELHNLDEITDVQEDDGWDWDDMNWMPNPADAEADYKSSKGLDVIGNLLSLFEAKDTVVREFQNILGERLLSPESDFAREIRVLELLKSRLGEGSLQGCEVMIKDIFDSSRTDLLIKKEQSIDQSAEGEPVFYSKMLSRFFWPSLRDDEFRVPKAVQALQDKFSHGFEEHKMQRKLTWLPALGQVTVELQLEDRTITELVSTWQASVIYAFQEEDEKGSPERTVEQIAEQLEMEEDLVNNALTFWISKLVLYQPSPGVYCVLESLPTESAAMAMADENEASAGIVAAAHTASAAAAANAASAVRSEEELLEEKMEVVWQYVVGMLTNQGSMALQQMVFMLNLVVPGGFQHSQDELRQYLQRKVDAGDLNMAGANYKIPKK